MQKTVQLAEVKPSSFRLRDLLEAYDQLQKQFPIQDYQERYSSLVTPNGNQNVPVQRWFRMKESFSIDLLGALLNQWKIPVTTISRMIDPFSGISTSSLGMQKVAKEKGLRNIETVGIERNPFLHFVSQTKLAWNELSPTAFGYEIKRFRYRMRRKDVRIPCLSTLRRVYDRRRLRFLLSIREAIQGVPTRERDLLLLGYANVLERASRVRKDGRALRINLNKPRIDVPSSLRSVWNLMDQDLRTAKNHFESLDSKVFLGDGRTLTVDEQPSLDLGEFDLAAYSPPYLNNIDYTEVYKVESWMCGFLDSPKRFRDLRYMTFRSHPSVRFPDEFQLLDDDRMTDVCHLLEILIGVLPRDEYLLGRRSVFNGYFDDMYLSLRRQREVLNSGGWLFCVIGNSMHGSNGAADLKIPVASDILSALIARNLGFEVRAIQIARFPKRRTRSRFVRESILVLRNP